MSPINLDWRHIYGSTISDVKDMFTRMKNRGEEFPEDVIELLEQK